jgi:hypothetical protein
VLHVTSHANVPCVTQHIRWRACQRKDAHHPNTTACVAHGEQYSDYRPDRVAVRGLIRLLSRWTKYRLQVPRGIAVWESPTN